MSASLQAGSTISHYRVVSPLGSGGMGEVYLAHDTSLERMVALKVLPPELMASEDRVRRFIQEAKSASSLSHPHIITIHEIGHAEVTAPDGEAESPGSGPIHYIAMELIEGDTLGKKIHRQHAPLKVLLAYLTQAAEGLSKAHAAGIVHRDLKPDNIMITQDGYAKVLDFGLAKLQSRKGGIDGATEAATAVRDKTREGVVMGTVGYMSPEQVQGKAADHRSDIFSFGCILYEAATGRRPFQGESDVDVMHKILYDKAEPIDEINPDAPTELRRLIRRCLAKEPEKRYQSMKDLALELGEMVEEFDELSHSSGSQGSRPSTSDPAVALGSKPRPVLAYVAGAVALVVLAGLVFALWRLRPAPKPAGPDTFSSMQISKLTNSGRVAIAGISGDGRYLAIATSDSRGHALWVRQVATGSDVPAVPPSSRIFRGVTFSPDGNYLYYVQAESDNSLYSILYQIPSLGGTPRKLLFDIDTPVTLSPDGKRMAFVRGYPMQRESAVVVINADGSGERKLAVRKVPLNYPLLQTSWSPDGKTIAAIGDNSLNSQLFAIDAATGKESPLGDRKWWGVSGLAWLPDGSGVVITAADKQENAVFQVWAISYPGGAVRKVTNDLNNYAGVSTTADGKTIATIQNVDYGNVWTIPSSNFSGARQLTNGTQELIQQVAAGPNGVVIAAVVSNGNSTIWSIDAEGNRKRLTEGTNDRGPSISADGRTILFATTREGTPHIWKMEADGSGQVQLTRGAGEVGPRVSPDGTWFTYRTTSGSVWRADIHGEHPVQLAPLTQDRPDISPDGKMVVYSHFTPEKDGRFGTALSVIPSNGGAPLHEITSDGRGPRFTPAGDALLCTLQVNGIGNLWRQPLDGSPAQQLTHFTDQNIGTHDWTPDGKTLVLARGDAIRDVVLIKDFR